MVFLDVDTETRLVGCYDEITIYDGDSPAGRVFFFGCGEENFARCAGNPGDGEDCANTEGGPCEMDGANAPAPVNYSFTSTHSTGCLTLRFDSDAATEEGGWQSVVTAAVPEELMRFTVE